MDIRDYFQKVREIESTIEDGFVIVSSLNTSDGGKTGSLIEVTRSTAARLIVDRRVRLATAEEVEQYRAEIERGLEEAENAAAASRIQVAIVSDKEARVTRPTRSKG